MSVDDLQVEDGYECPTCEKVLNTSLGLKQHHTKVHGQSLVETAVCVWCGDEFHKKPTQEGRFCSRECFGKHRTENGVPARKRQVELTCDHCGDVFSINQSKAEERRYCSKECYHKDSDRDTVSCEICGDDFQVYGQRVDDARFCGQECYGTYLSRTTSGKNSPHWKGGKFEHKEYGPGWGERKRNIVRDRDNRMCTECGMEESKHLEKYNMKLHVHHKVVARNSSNPAVHNAPRNLTTLCISCHLSKH